MKVALLQRFVALADTGVHFPRTADALGIPLASLYSSIDKLEAEVGHPLLARTKTGIVLSPAGELLLEEARRQIAAAPATTEAVKAPAGGKAKASKGKGRAPSVKGQPKTYKKRQGR